MTGRTTTERILDAFLAPEADRLPDRVLDAALDRIARSPQRHAPRVPWRFPHMPAVSRATAIAAAALVAVVGAGGLVYLTSNRLGNVGGGPTPTPSATPAPRPEPTVGPTKRAEVAPGIYGWKTYTSPVYGYTISYPDDWEVSIRATETWAPGQPDWSAVSADGFENSRAVDEDGIAYLALQFGGPPEADLASWEGLMAALREMCGHPDDYPFGGCPAEYTVTRLCLGSPGCQPVAIVHAKDFEPRSIFGDPETGVITFIQMGRVDDYPAAERYGGSVTLLKSVLSQLGVREPRPDETPN